MYKILYCAVFSVLLANCTSKQAVEATSSENTTTTPFSDSIKLDTFKVSLEGSQSNTSHLSFKIISFEGKKIYSVNIKGEDLIKENESLKTESDKMAYLKNQVRFFFEDEHAIWPAVLPDETASKYVPDTVFYNELKQTKLNGFSYRQGKEAKIYIAWSIKDKKVKPYFEMK